MLRPIPEPAPVTTTTLLIGEPFVCGSFWRESMESMEMLSGTFPLGLGCAALGNLYREVTDDQAKETFDAAWDAGVRLYDVAPHYGLGVAERRLGELLTAVPRDEVLVSTKVGRLLEPLADGENVLDTQGFAVSTNLRRVFDFSDDGVVRSLESSLSRLAVDRIDVVLLHDPDDHLNQALGEAYPALERLRTEKMVRAIGVGTNRSAVAERFVRDSDIDVVLIAGRWTLLDQSAGESLLPMCHERRVDVMVGGVLNSGILGNEHPDESSRYNYRPVQPEVLVRAQALAAACARHGISLPHAATAFAARHPAVTAVLVGARNASEVQAAADAINDDLDQATLDELAAIGRGETRPA
jgi:D-threo-aldose 1-dehydrogenase